MNAPLDILYEDNHLLVINKPAGLLTQPSGTEQNSLEQIAKNWMKITYQKPGRVFLEAVHRLDKPVSGIVVFGKTSKALSRLNEAIRNKEIKKKYYALVEGFPNPTQGILEHFMIHDDFCAQIVSIDHPHAKLARLAYEVIQSKDNISLVEIELETGRYHQIRLQFSTIGCPVVGDTKYGSKVKFESQAIALHHHYLNLIHPTTKEMLQFEAAIPDYFKL